MKTFLALKKIAIQAKFIVTPNPTPWIFRADYPIPISRYNINNAGTEGGFPNIHPAFASGQDSFLASLATQGTSPPPSPSKIPPSRKSTTKTLTTTPTYYQHTGIMNSTYHEALSFCQTSTRENGIDHALTHDNNNSTKLSALLVPPDVGQTYQIAAQAGNPSPPPHHKKH